MHWLKLTECKWINLDKAYSIHVWETGILIMFSTGNNPDNKVVISSQDERYQEILEDVQEVLGSKSGKREEY